MLARVIRTRRRASLLFMGLAGLFGATILLLLTGNVAVRIFGLNIVWVSELSRVLFVWGVAFGMTAVSLSGRHFRVDLLSATDTSERELEGWWEIVLQLGACAVLVYIAYYAWPTIARAAEQPMASIPLSYGTFRGALVFALIGMLIAHLWRAAELCSGPRHRSR